MSRRKAHRDQLDLFQQLDRRLPPLSGLAAKDQAKAILGWQGSRLGSRDIGFLSAVATMRHLSPEQGRRMARLVARLRGQP